MRCGCVCVHVGMLFVLSTVIARSAWMGNPRFYSTFLDESLNLNLRDAAAAAHRNRMEVRIFRLFALQGSLGLAPFLFGAKGRTA